jgi:hypothetical protein
VRWLIIALFLTCAACGGDSSSGSGGDTGEGGAGGGTNQTCEPGTLPDGAGCIEAGLRAWPCPPGEHDGANGCAAAGIAICGEGFDLDEAVGCAPRLPTTACTDGQMAIMGETLCRPVHPCAPGTWGDIVVGADTQHVDQAFVGVSDGSATNPWTTIQAAIDSAAPNAVVAIARGTYPEALNVDRPVTVWGVCPAEVEVTGVAAEPTITVAVAGEGATVRHVGITGPDGGVDADASVTLDGVWLHDTGFIGLVSLGSLQRSVRVVDSLFERSGSVAIGVSGVAFEIERSVVRDTQPNSEGGFGQGVLGGGDASSRGSFVATRSLFDGNTSVSIDLESTEAVLRDCVVQNTKPRADNQARGRAIEMTKRDDADGGELTLERVVLRDNRDAAMRLVDSSASMTDTAIVDTAPAQADDSGGYGVLVSSQDAPASIEIARSLIGDAHGYGVLGFDANVTLDATVIRDVRASPGDQSVGRGVMLDVSNPSPATLTITGSRLERLVDGGVLALGGDLVMTDVAVAEVSVNPVSGDRGYGVFAQASTAVGATIRAQATRVTVKDVGATGFAVIGGDATLADLHVADVRATQAISDDGYGVVFQQFPDGLPSAGTISHSLIERAHLAALLVAGAEITARSVVLRDTQPEAGALGRGLQMEVLPTVVLPTSALVQGSVIDTHPDGGIVNLGGALTVEDCAIRHIVPNNPGVFGGGIVSQRAPVSLTVPSANVVRSHVDDCDGFGIINVGGELVVTASLITNTTATSALWGDGIAVEHPAVQGAEPFATNAVIRDTTVEGSARGGITNFGAHVTLSGARLICNAFALNAEVNYDVEATFSDEGDNLCSCGDQTVPCKAASAMLAPPPAQ